MSNSVIIVDDAEFMRLMLKDIVTEMDLQVLGEGANGAEAVDLYQKLQPDLVIMDITMPEMDGIDALREIIQQDDTARVIMIAALGQKDKVLESIQAGACDFLIKPFEPERVKATISEVLQRATVT
jgi:two-component system chemotaxis response regulator CheY